jgi:hypothetical protein
MTLGRPLRYLALLLGQLRGVEEQKVLSLRAAAEAGDLAAVRAVLDQPELPPIDTPEKDGRTALILAATGGHVEVVTELLGRGADKDARSRIGWTALLAGAYGGHQGVVELLLQMGADTNITDYAGRSALTWAARRGHQAVVEVLRVHGACSKVRNRRITAQASRAIAPWHAAYVTAPCVPLDPRQELRSSPQSRLNAFLILVMLSQVMSIVPPPTKELSQPATVVMSDKGVIFTLARTADTEK